MLLPHRNCCEQKSEKNFLKIILVNFFPSCVSVLPNIYSYPQPSVFFPKLLLKITCKMFFPRMHNLNIPVRKNYNLKIVVKWHIPIKVYEVNRSLFKFLLALSADLSIELWWYQKAGWNYNPIFTMTFYRFVGTLTNLHLSLFHVNYIGKKQTLQFLFSPKRICKN